MLVRLAYICRFCRLSFTFTMAQCAKLLRTVCPKFSFVNRSACLTVPLLISERRSALGHRKSNFSSSAPKSKKETVVMYFMDRDGDRVEVTACVGDNLLDVAIKNDVELEVNNGGLYVDRISLTFVKANDERLETKAKVGDSLLDTVVDNDLDIDGYGACEGTLACSTCHLIFKQENYDQLPEPTDEENDMLDLAFDLQDTSRLGCQVTVTKEMDGWEVRVPSGVSDARDL